MRLKAKELKAYRDQLLNSQGGLDPITGMRIEDPCLDHDHKSGRIRGVLDRRTNAWEGKVINAWRRCGLQKAGAPLSWSLIQLASYIHEDYDSRPLHPAHRTADEKRLVRNKKARLKRRKT